MTNLTITSIVMICVTILMIVSMYFNHKEKMEQIKLESKNKEEK